MSWTRRTAPGWLSLVLWQGLLSAAWAQPAPAEPAPAEPAPAAQPAAPTDPAQGAPAPATESAPAAAPDPAPAEPPPPSFPDASPQPPAEPPPPQYGKLGGEPEPEIKEGDWDPWDHAPVGKHRHDGFFLRLAVGFGGGSVQGDGGSSRFYDSIEYSGGGFGFDIAIGGALVDNLILHGEIFQMSLFDPDVEAPGTGYETAEDLGIEDISVAGLGAGVTYYFMPINIYLGGTLAFGEVIYEDDQGDLENSDVGLALSVIVGKEWWVGIDWGIGVAVQLVHLTTEDRIDGDLNANTLTLMFSATHN